MQVNQSAGYNVMNAMNTVASNRSMQDTMLSDDEKAQVAEILSRYDSENLSEEDAKAIREAFKENGIAPGRGLDEAVKEAGFAVEDIRGTPPPPGGGMMPPPPPGDQEESDPLASFLGNLSTEEQTDTLTRLSTLSTEGYEALRNMLEGFREETEGMNPQEKSKAFSSMLDGLFEKYSGSSSSSFLVESIAVDTYA